jgi:dihydropteroate synthase
MSTTVDRLSDRLLAAHRERRPLVMGIVNVTPDSFSDGGRYDRLELALAHGRRLARQGADLLDIGGESTRPGAAEVSVDSELQRVIPVIQALADQVDVPISIDTSKPEVMRAAVAAGAIMINDINGLQAAGAVETVAELDAMACIMHMQGRPRTMQEDPHYEDVVSEVRQFLADRLVVCRAAGVAPERLCVDPGFGFGKTLEHNLTLLRELDAFRELGAPVLAGISRKSMIGAITGREDPDERLAGSLAAAVIATLNGAAIIRVHDVAATVDAVKVVNAISASAVK